MVGIYGTIGTSDEFDNVREHFFLNGNEYSTKYKDSNKSIHAVFHNKKEAQSQPVEKNDVHLFIWGEICGYGDLNQYESRKNMESELTDAEYCAKLYEKYGIDFIKKLNSNFAGVIIDNENSKTHLFTDRLSSRPLYYTKSPDGSLIFSTNLQAVARHSNYEIQFEKEFLCQYLTMYKVLGIYTPLKKIKQLHPGSILTFEKNTVQINEKVYWRPKYNPSNKNFHYFVDSFTEIFDDVMDDRLDENKDYGLLLSGGTDSRIIADYIEGKTAFHMNETLNREAKLAKKVAELTENEFVFLKRDQKYYPRVLESVTPFMNFNSYFKAAQAIGFNKELQTTDVIISGHYADNVLLGLYIPKKKLEFPFLYPLKLLFKNTVKKKIDSINDFFKHIENKNPDYLNYDFHLGKSTEANYEISNQNSEKPNLNGVYFSDLETITNYWTSYPITNARGTLFYESLNQVGITSLPYIDNRIIEFSLSLPTKYKIKRDIVKNALHKKNRNLSKIIHPKSLQPAYRHELIHCTFQSLHSTLDDLKHHMEGEGSWSNVFEIMKETGCAEKKIREHKETFDKFDYLDYEKCQLMIESPEKYNSLNQINSLLSFLNIYNKIIS